MARASSPCIRSTDSRVRATSARTPTDGLDKTVQATWGLGETPTPLRGTGFQPVHSWHGQSCPCFGLDTAVQATVCLGETPKPRPSAGRRRYAVQLLKQSLRQVLAKSVLLIHCKM
ncbi:MAG: hypothetical protein NZ874_09350 [Fimbriimonadales bacterium]|nr:hypothetical protein [Fimbriimonadales bacterium]